jgi:hypothetical protein
MSEQYTDRAKERMGAIERVIKGLPGIRGYVDKELRRDADKQVRNLLATQLEEQKQALFQVQQTLLRNGGLQHMGELDAAIQKLQILIDRTKSASYGYAGLFDAVRIQENELDALYRFDVALAARAVDLRSDIEAVAGAVAANEQIRERINQLSAQLTELNNLFNRRGEAIRNPELLTQPAYLPEVEPELLNPGGSQEQA